jgi:FtsH-binding integral membrane protein
MSAATATLLFWIHAAVIGLSHRQHLSRLKREIAGKKAVLGALALYLDVISRFMLLLQLSGSAARIDS